MELCHRAIEIRLDQREIGASGTASCESSRGARSTPPELSVPTGRESASLHRPGPDGGRARTARCVGYSGTRRAAEPPRVPAAACMARPRSVRGERLIKYW